MSVRRKTANRLVLHRKCGTCGKMIVTTADTPWVRQVERDGKKQATTYFCCSKCFAASYKHIGWYDGKAEERRREREAKRDTREKSRRCYAAHAEELREKARRYRKEHPGVSAADSAYQRRKRKLLREEAELSA
jgi:hypothetical protein